MNFKGSLQLLILNVLAEGPNHGYRIAMMIKEHSKGVLDFKEGTLYPTLHTMEQDGWLETFTEEENGRTRRYYRLTNAGLTALQHQRKEWEQYVKAVNMSLEGNA
jgi:PadR family transcriptional regulator, regulatory protein PadR